MTAWQRGRGEDGDPGFLRCEPFAIVRAESIKALARIRVRLVSAEIEDERRLREWPARYDSLASFAAHGVADRDLDAVRDGEWSKFDQPVREPVGVAHPAFRPG
jgi:hypothetical protein